MSESKEIIRAAELLNSREEGERVEKVFECSFESYEWPSLVEPKET